MTNQQVPLGTSRKFIWKLAAFIVIIAAIGSLIVILIDPFFHYHAPWFGLKAVQTEKEYQVVGALRHLSYDSVIAGSSVAENNNNHWFDEDFNTKSVKAIRSYGATADLCFFLEQAHRDHELSYVFYNIDPSSLAADPTTTFALSGCPLYLYDDSPWNDFRYLLNKDVFFEKIPYMLAQSASGYDEGTSYNWWQWKTFSTASILSNYRRSLTVKEMLPETTYKEELEGNLALLTKEISAHPETEYYLFFPPYSILWWDMIYRSGELESYLYNEEQAMNRLLSYDNVHLYNFQVDTDITTNLDLYLDSLHFSEEVNHVMEQTMASGEGELTKAAIPALMKDLRSFAYDVQSKYILPYENDLLYEEPTEASKEDTETTTVSTGLPF